MRATEFLAGALFGLRIRRILPAVGILVVMSSFAACGGGSSKPAATPVQSVAGNSASPTAGQTAASDPTKDGYACSLLTKAEVQSAGGSPAKDPTHTSATVGGGQSVTDCVVTSVADCPQNLPQDAPFCDKAYRAEWTVDVFSTAAAAKAQFDKDRQQQTTPITVTGADPGAVYFVGGSAEAEKGAALVTMGYSPPSTLSGNISVARRTLPGQDVASAALLGFIMARLP